MTEKKYEIITSKDNSVVKLFGKLSQSRKNRRENGLFVLEGARLCFDAAHGGNVRTLIVSEYAAEKYGDLLSDFGGKIICVSEEIAEKLSDTRNTQGVFAICEIMDNPKLSEIIAENGKYIVLDGLQDPVNIGTVIRTADAVGITAVILCSCCDIYNPKVVRGTMGSMFRIKLAEYEYSEVMEFFSANGVKTYAAVVNSDAESLTDCDFSGKTAVVIGNEGNGLSDEDAALCDEKITIKMQGNIESLNAAMATGIIAWEMLR